MRSSLLHQRFLVLAALCCLGFGLKAALPTPESHFGFTPGEDRKMFTYEPMIAYMEQLASASGKVHMERIGNSEMGRPIYLILVSSEENIGRLDRLREINRALALDEIPDAIAREALIGEGKVFFLSTLSMHATEVGPTQALPLTVYELINGTDPRREAILENTVAMFIQHNPDGMNMIVEHYNQYRDTPFEGSSLPGVYHKYVGHNINRDFVTLSQSENQAVADVYSTIWFPQAMVERHQMGSSGPRFFVSPPHDPVAENIDPGIWNWMRVYGSRALTEMTEAGLKSVSVNYLFDNYWPGATSTANWKGVVAMLSEAASVNIASPIYVEPGELRTIGKGLGEYAISINLPRPWEGGWWRLSDILRYEMENTLSYLHTSAIHREEILQSRNEISRREIARGSEEAPYYYIMPQKQHDLGEMVALVNLLGRHGVRSYRLEADVEIENRLFRQGDVVVPLAQPYRAFIKEVLEAQKFPARHYTPGGEMIRPYDITSWSLPLHRGVEAVEVNHPVAEMERHIVEIPLPYSLSLAAAPGDRWAVFPATRNESYKAAFMALERGLRVDRTTETTEAGGMVIPEGSFIMAVDAALGEITEELLAGPVYLDDHPGMSTRRLHMPRIGLVETWFHDMDAGWTRYLFDTYHIPYTVLRPADLQTARLDRDFDMLIFSDQSHSALMHGRQERAGQLLPSRYPPAYARGMEKQGFENLMRFVNGGGKVMAWGPAVELFMGPISLGEGEDREDFMLPVSNIGRDLSGRGLYIPGALMKVNLRNGHPLTLGMPQTHGVFHRGNPVFRTSLPYFDMDRRVIATFAKDNVLMSGYSENEELLHEEAALVWVGKGDGQIVLSSFNPQFRASTQVTFKLLFNAVLME